MTTLSAPFAPETVSWRLGALNEGKTRGMALAYIDARDVQDRLNEVCGPDWQVRHPWASGSLIACEIGIRIEGEWIWRGDGAGEAEVDDSLSGQRKEQQLDMARKAAFSDSFKRAAVRWGIGRYLYDIAAPWVDIEARGRSYIIKESEIARLRAMLRGNRAEPPQRPAAAPAVSPAAPQRLQAIHDAIWKALEMAQHQEQIDGILRVHTDDLEKISDRSKEHADNMRAFAARRKALLPTIAQLKAQAQAEPQELMDVSGQP